MSMPFSPTRPSVHCSSCTRPLSSTSRPRHEASWHGSMRQWDGSILHERRQAHDPASCDAVQQDGVNKALLMRDVAHTDTPLPPSVTSTACGRVVPTWCHCRAATRAAVMRDSRAACSPSSTLRLCGFTGSTRAAWRSSCLPPRLHAPEELRRSWRRQASGLPNTAPRSLGDLSARSASAADKTDGGAQAKVEGSGARASTCGGGGGA